MLQIVLDFSFEVLLGKGAQRLQAATKFFEIWPDLRGDDLCHQVLIIANLFIILDKDSGLISHVGHGRGSGLEKGDNLVEIIWVCLGKTLAPELILKQGNQILNRGQFDMLTVYPVQFFRIKDTGRLAQVL